jgi:filamentous hemagglutinin family protein
VLWLAGSQAQVRTTLTPDGTLGTTVTPNGNVYTIAGGTRPHNGPNLFHSFDRFSVGTGDTAHFTATEPAGVVNILSRVTGGQRSEIDGKLQSTIPGAHLYLLNPSGVLFGPNATLDVQGSFHVSTADYLRLADGARFFARLSERSTFSVAPPVAFGFLGPTPASMTVNGSALQVPRGETIALVGGEIAIAGNVEETVVNVPAALPTLRAPEGHIHLVSVGSAGEVATPPTGQPLDLEVGAVNRLGRLHLSRGALVDVSTQGEGPAGRVSVVANDVHIENGHIVARTTSRGTGGEIGIRAGKLTLTGGAEISVSTQGEGPAGRATVKANDVHIENGQISATASSRGDGGEITVEADTVMLKGRDTPTETFNERPTDTTGQAQLSGQTKGEGRGGRVHVVARDIRLEDGKIRTRTFGDQDSGEITIQTGTLTLTGQAEINASTGSRASRGQGGNVTVRASEALMITGADTNPARIASDTLGKGNAGQVVVSAPTVLLENGRIQAIDNENSAGLGGRVVVQGDTVTLTRGARISSSSFGAGQGGNVTVVANKAVLVTDSNSQIASSANGSGDGGRVDVSAPTVRLEARGSITTEVGLQTATGAPSSGNAGNIEVQAGTITILDGGRITSRTRGAGRGGNVTVRASEAIIIAGPGPGATPSGLRSNTEGQGQGGNIMVQAPRVELSDRAAISAESTGPGNAGNVTFSLSDTFVSTNSSIVTRATQADGGNIQITAPTLVRLRDSAITAEVKGGATTVGGNITIDPQFVLLQNSQIVANAFRGRGGNIRIQAQQAFLADPASQVNASSALGINGQVNIQAPVTNLSGTVAPLLLVFASAATLLRSACAARLHEGTISTLVERGRAGVPATPDGVLPSRLPLAPLDPATPAHAGGPPSATLVWPLRESQLDPSGPLQGWAASVDALRPLPGDCASR